MISRAFANLSTGLIGGLLLAVPPGCLAPAQPDWDHVFPGVYIVEEEDGIFYAREPILEGRFVTNTTAGPWFEWFHEDVPAHEVVEGAPELPSRGPGSIVQTELHVPVETRQVEVRVRGPERLGDYLAHWTLTDLQQEMDEQNVLERPWQSGGIEWQRLAADESFFFTFRSPGMLMVTVSLSATEYTQGSLYSAVPLVLQSNMTWTLAGEVWPLNDGDIHPPLKSTIAHEFIFDAPIQDNRALPSVLAVSTAEASGSNPFADVDLVLFYLDDLGEPMGGDCSMEKPALGRRDRDTVEETEASLQGRHLYVRIGDVQDLCGVTGYSNTMPVQYHLTLAVKFPVDPPGP